jgi:hypothetical protein
MIVVWDNYFRREVPFARIIYIVKQNGLFFYVYESCLQSKDYYDFKGHIYRVLLFLSGTQHP